jgi:hypothetical protein
MSSDTPQEPRKRHRFIPANVGDSFAAVIRIILAWWHRAIDIKPGFDKEKLLPENHWVIAGFSQALLAGMMLFYGFNIFHEYHDLTRLFFAFSSAGILFLIINEVVAALSTHTKWVDYTSVPALAFMPIISIAVITGMAIGGNLPLLGVPFYLFLSFWLSGPVNEKLKEMYKSRRSVWHWYWMILTTGREIY